MKLEDVEATLYARFSTANPCWSASIDSNAISFFSAGGSPDLAVAVDRDQAIKIRSIDENNGRIAIDVNMFGLKLAMYLFGKKVNDISWKGVASVDFTFCPKNEMLLECEMVKKCTIIKFPNFR